MRLGWVLFRKNRLPNGHLFRGKDRLVKKVEAKHLNRLQQDFAIEEQNMFYLRFPYLTEAESNGHSKSLGKNRARLAEKININKRCFKEDVTLYERLSHLRTSESWD